METTSIEQQLAAIEVYCERLKVSKCTHGMDGDEDICDGCAYERQKLTSALLSDLPALCKLVRELLQREQWIACTERMPEVGQLCWVVWCGHVQHCAYVYGGTSFRLPDSIAAFIEGDDIPVEEVSHWRAITPPETGDGR